MAGDMDISYINDMLPGRQRVATTLLSNSPPEIAQVHFSSLKSP